METIDFGHLVARVRMLEGQARFTRAMLAAVMGTHPNPERLAELMSVTWSDLQTELGQPSSPEAVGAQSAWNALQHALEAMLRP